MTKVCLVFGLTLFVFSLVQEAEAIPTFARKYRTSCTTCHIGFNKLNPFGEAYRLNGYQIPQGQEVAYVKEEPVSLGAPAWKKVWPEAVWPGQIPGNVPISMMVHQRALWNESASGQSKPELDFRFPHEWELFVSGDLGEMLSFYGEFALLDDGAVGGMERLFLQFNDLLAGSYDILPQDALNLKVGKFNIAADPFYNPTRRTLNRTLPSNYTVGNATFRLRNPQSALEADGILNQRWYYGLGLANGTNAADGSDADSHKDPYWRLAYKWKGMAFDGSSEELGDELKQTNNWVDNSLTVGGFGYYGKQRIAGVDNPFYRTGFDGRLQWEDMDLSGAMVFGEDDDPTSTGSSDSKIKSHTWFVQAEYVVYPWLIPALRYEQSSFNGTTNSVKRFIPSLSMYARANLRFILEGVIVQDAADGNNQFLADLAFAF